MGQVLRPAWRVGVRRARGGGLEGSRGAREGGATHWLTEGLGLGGPHVQVGHHGLQPLALLGKLWRVQRPGVSSQALFRLHIPPDFPGSPYSHLHSPPSLRTPAPSGPCLSGPSHPRGQDRDRLLAPRSPPRVSSRARVPGSGSPPGRGRLPNSTRLFSPARAEAVAEQHPSPACGTCV